MDQDILGDFIIEEHIKEEEASIDLQDQLALQHLGLQPQDRRSLPAIPVVKKDISQETVRETSECLYDRTGWGHGQARPKQWS